MSKTDKKWEEGDYKYKIKVAANNVNVSSTEFTNYDNSTTLTTNTIQLSHHNLRQNLNENGSLNLTVKVIFKFIGKAFIPKVHSTTIVQQSMYSKYSQLLNDPSLSDFTFIVQEKEFKVHKVILGLASPVMHKMFATDMKEVREGKCKVDDIEPETFENLLQFIYSGKWPKDVDELVKLYKVAHYYRIEELKEICQDELHNALTTENAWIIYALACIYELDELKLNAWNIIKQFVSNFNLI